MTPPRLPNLHATAVVLGDRGVLITGPSGSGKTTLALALIESEAGHAALVSDDQCLLEGCHGRLIARAPDSISGLVEVRGLGPAPIDARREAVIDLVVELTPPDQAERMPAAQTRDVQGVALPLLVLPQRHAPGARQAIRGWLGLPPLLQA